MSRLVFLLFFLSGATSLVYEVLWMRRLSLIFGHSIFSVSTVLTTFMAGLALGSFFAGRWSDLRRSEGKTAAYFLASYGRLEFFIGLWALASLPMLAGIEGLYFRLSASGLGKTALLLLIFCSAFVILLPPTVAMGATLPVFTQTLVLRQSETGTQLSRLYGFNTLGACLGGALGGVFFLPSFGLLRSVLITATVNALIAIAAIVLSSKLSQGSTQDDSLESSESLNAVESSDASVGIWLPLVFGISGFSGMLYQLGWTRALVLTMGSSTYSFSLILTAFLAALSLGSLLYKRLYSARQPRVNDLAVLQVFIALTALLGTQVMGKFPLFKVWALKNLVSSFLTSALADTAAVFLMLLLPTLAMGLTFPLVTHLYASRLEEVGKSLGEAYATNTAGAILGSFLGGFIAIPYLGAQNSINLAALLNLLGGCALMFLCYSKKRLTTQVGLGLALSTILVLLFAPSWNQALMSSGPAVYRSASTLRRPHFYRDGITSTVTVGLNGKSQVFLAVNGKVDASLAERDRQTQLLLGLVPSALHPAPKSVGVVGFGSGQTVIGLLSNPLVEKVVCAELEPAVLEAKKFFRPFSEGYFEDPRLKIVEDDGRSFVLGSNKKFDLIVSEPSNPWIAGIGNLYTADFYQGCRQKLNEGGLMCQWFHLYAMGETDVQMVFRTFYSVFPEGQLFRTSGGDIMLIGSDSPVRIRPELLAKMWSTPSMARWLYSFGLVSPDMFYATHLASRQEVTSYLAERGVENGPLNTDDRPLLEFQAPLALFRSDSVLQRLGEIFPALVPEILSDDASVIQGSVLGRAMLGFPLDLERAVGKLQALDPSQQGWRTDLFLFWFEVNQENSNPLSSEKIPEYESEKWIKHFLLAALYRGRATVDSSELTQLALRDDLPGAGYTLNLNGGRNSASLGRWDKDNKFFLAASELSPSDEALAELAQLGPVEQRDFLVAKAAVERNPYNAKSRYALGLLYYRDGDLQSALIQAEESFRLYSLDPKAAKLLADCYQALGRTGLATEMLTEWGRLQSLEAMQKKLKKP